MKSPKPGKNIPPAPKTGMKKHLPAALLFAGIVIVRFLLALATSTYPVVGIDEFLYSSLGRSIATEGSLLYYGQPADYSYILYPLVLSPVYLLFGEGANFYRILQFWNILLMTLSVFPVHALCRRLLREEKKALWAAVLCMLLPDFILGQRIFSEAILYPLFFGSVYYIYRYIEDREPKSLLAVGVLGGLMYCTKPGSIVHAVLFLILALAGSLARKEKKAALCAAGSMLAFCAVSAVFWCLARFAFGYSGSLLSIYGTQLGEEDLHLDVFFTSILKYPFYFILACGIIGFIYPFLTWKHRNETEKKFGLFLLASLIILIIGTSWIINRDEYNIALLHIRYMAMYIPPVLLFCFLPGEETAPESKKAKRAQAAMKPRIPVPAVIILAVVVISTVVWGSKTGAKVNEIYPLMSLAILTDRVFPLSSQLIVDIAVVILCAASLFVVTRYRGKGMLRKICVTALGLFMAVNTVCGYVITAEEANPQMEEEAWDTLRMTDGKDFIYLKTIYGQLDCGICLNTKRNPDVVLLYDFLNHMVENDGYYVPFVPTELRGYRPERLTADTDTLVLDDASYSLVSLNSEAASIGISPGSKFGVVHFTPGERLLDSAIGNVNNRVLKKESTGVLVIFDLKLLEKPLTVRLDINSSRPQNMEVICGNEKKTVALNMGRAWYDITFDRPGDAVNFMLSEEDVKVYGYELTNPEQ